MSRSPRDALASSNARTRRRAQTLVANRVSRGWSREDAEIVPVRREGRADVTVPEWPELHGEPYSADPIARAIVGACDDGLTHEMIGALMGISRQAAHAIETRALERLRDGLAAIGVDASDVAAMLASRGPRVTDMSSADAPHGGASRRSSAGIEAEQEARIGDGPQSPEVLRWYAALDSVAERAAANRMVERVVCGMEIAGGAW